MTRGEYLASREWALKKRAVKERANGMCERCGAVGAQVHHRDYSRMFNELLTDLLYVCEPCHKFLSGLSDIDPAEQKPAISTVSFWDQAWNELAMNTRGEIWGLIAKRCDVLSTIRCDMPAEERVAIQRRAKEIGDQEHSMVEARAKELAEEYESLVAK